LISRLLKSSTLTSQKPDLPYTSQVTLMCYWCVLPAEFALTAAVAEFKGPHIHGVVRIAQVSMELVRIEASLNGLTPGLHAWSINNYGDLTRGAASTGGIFNGSGESKKPDGLVSSLLFSS
jgi:copper chaperone for superoxide dismutase